MTLLALDIGGTKFAARIAPDGTILARSEHPIGPSPTDTLRRLVAEFAVPDLAVPARHPGHGHRPRPGLGPLRLRRAGPHGRRNRSPATRLSGSSERSLNGSLKRA